MQTLGAANEFRGYRFNAHTLPRAPKRRLTAKLDLTGKTFGRLKAVDHLGLTHIGGFRWWGCLCECGVKVSVRSRELVRGNTQSCGCLNLEKVAERGGRNKLPVGHASRNELLASYIKSAAGRGHEWGIDAEEFFTLVSSSCSYCGTPPDRVRKPNAGVNGGFTYTGIDRLDNDLGYVPGNVISCCWDCNRAKGALTVYAFVEWINRISIFKRSAHVESGGLA